MIQKEPINNHIISKKNNIWKRTIPITTQHNIIIEKDGSYQNSLKSYGYIITDDDKKNI